MVVQLSAARRKARGRVLCEGGLTREFTRWWSDVDVSALDTGAVRITPQDYAHWWYHYNS
jgi:hypothetical protein